jgi:hypothetical protein
LSARRRCARLLTRLGAGNQRPGQEPGEPRVLAGRP